MLKDAKSKSPNGNWAENSVCQHSIFSCIGHHLVTIMDPEVGYEGCLSEESGIMLISAFIQLKINWIGAAIQGLCSYRTKKVSEKPGACLMHKNKQNALHSVTLGTVTYVCNFVSNQSRSVVSLGENFMSFIGSVHFKMLIYFLGNILLVHYYIS